MPSKEYEIVQNTADNLGEVRATVTHMTLYFDSKNFKVISHSIYHDPLSGKHVINMIGRG